MELSGWIQLLVPIISNLFFSGFIIVILTKKIENHYDLQSKKEHYAYVVMGDIKKTVGNVKKSYNSYENKFD